MRLSGPSKQPGTKFGRGGAETRRNPGSCFLSPRLCVSASFLLALLAPAYGQQLICRRGGGGGVNNGRPPAATRLRIRAHGPVTLEGGTVPNLTYSVRITASARTDAEARRIVMMSAVRVETG